jgi:uroporphyrinogen decarboxylase
MMVEISSKELVKGVFHLKEMSRTPFIPWICTFAAQLEQISIQDMMSDPGLLSTALLNAQELFGYDAIVTVFDPSLEAEACRCQIEWWDEDGSPPQIVGHPLSEGVRLEALDILNFEKRGRIPVVTETIKRINIMRGKQIAIMGVVSGPFTLASHLKGESLWDDLKQGSSEATQIIAAAGSIGLALSRKYCELGVDVIVIADKMLGNIDPGLYKVVTAPLKSIWNITKFFGVHSLLLTTGCTTDSVEPILNLQAEGVALGANVDGKVLQDKASKRTSCFGHSIPASILNAPSELEKYAGDCLSIKTRGCFLTTDWEVPYATSVETMHELMRVFNSYK